MHCIQLTTVYTLQCYEKMNNHQPRKKLSSHQLTKKQLAKKVSSLVLVYSCTCNNDTVELRLVDTPEIPTSTIMRTPQLVLNAFSIAPEMWPSLIYKVDTWITAHTNSPSFQRH